MPHERITGVPMTGFDADGKQIWAGTGVLDISWGKDLQGITVGMSLHEDDTVDQPGRILSMPEGQTVSIGSWSQINNALRVLKRARNDAFGTPE